MTDDESGLSTIEVLDRDEEFSANLGHDFESLENLADVINRISDRSRNYETRRKELRGDITEANDELDVLKEEKDKTIEEQVGLTRMIGGLYDKIREYERGLKDPFQDIIKANDDVRTVINADRIDEGQLAITHEARTEAVREYYENLNSGEIPEMINQVTAKRKEVTDKGEDLDELRRKISDINSQREQYAGELKELMETTGAAIESDKEKLNSILGSLGYGLGSGGTSQLPERDQDAKPKKALTPPPDESSEYADIFVGEGQISDEGIFAGFDGSSGESTEPEGDGRIERRPTIPPQDKNDYQRRISESSGIFPLPEDSEENNEGATGDPILDSQPTSEYSGLFYLLGKPKPDNDQLPTIPPPPKTKGNSDPILEPKFEDKGFKDKIVRVFEEIRGHVRYYQNEGATNDILSDDPKDKYVVLRQLFKSSLLKEYDMKDPESSEEFEDPELAANPLVDYNPKDDVFVLGGRHYFYGIALMFYSTNFGVERQDAEKKIKEMVGSIFEMYDPELEAEVDCEKPEDLKAKIDRMNTNDAAVHTGTMRKRERGVGVPAQYRDKRLIIGHKNVDAMIPLLSELTSEAYVKNLLQGNSAGYYVPCKIDDPEEAQLLLYKTIAAIETQSKRDELALLRNLAEDHAVSTLKKRYDI